MTETDQSTGRRNQRVEIGGPGEVHDAHADIFFTAVETTRMPMIVTDPRQPDNPIIFANQAFLSMTGYRSDEIVGTNCRFLQGPDTDRATVAEVRAAIERNEEFSTEILNYRKDGSTFWNALFLSPIHNQAGELVYFFASQLDVSRRRDAEQALSQAQKMEALGQLTGGIAHDFNNLLQVVSGYTDMLLAMGEKPPIDPVRHQRAAQNIRTAADRAAKLTQQLLAFSRKQRLEGRPISLNALVEAMDTMVGRTLGDHVEIVKHLDPSLWSSRADPTQAELAIINILVNARDAMPDGGTVTITTRNEQIDEIEARFVEGLLPGRYAVVDIVDTGTGIHPDILPRIVEPFFTTKEEGKGTGLGLATVYGFMKQSGGAIRIGSEVGRGTRVRLYFPASDAEPQIEVKPRLRIEDRQGHERILIVDDRPEVAETAQAILDEYGYETLVAHNGRDALDILAKAKGFDMLFTDLIMPGGMNGIVLAREARARFPKLKVLLTTGYAEASLERTDAGGSEFEIINKPYRRIDLIRLVRRVLDGHTGVS